VNPTMTALLLLACAGPSCNGTGDDSGLDSDSGTTATGPGFSLMADELSSGMLLSAWTDGEQMLAVGGSLGSGPGTVTHWRDGELCVETEAHDRGLWWIHGPRVGEWYAVGFAGRILHDVDGVRTVEDVETDATLFGVWAADDGTVWAVGGEAGSGEPYGEVWRRTDGTWELHSELSLMLFKVWDGWMVGEQQIYQLVGDELVAHDTVWLLDDDGQLYEETVAADAERGWSGIRLLTVRGRNDTDDVWAVGGMTSSMMLHYDGDRWEEVTTAGVGQPLNGVWTAEGEDVHVAGHFGTTATWSSETESWTQPLLPVTNQHFHGVWKHADEVYWVGGDLFGAGDRGTIARYGEDPSAVIEGACE